MDGGKEEKENKEEGKGRKCKSVIRQEGMKDRKRGMEKTMTG